MGIHFGTDGWRAVLDQDFNEKNVRRATDAIAKVFREDKPLGGRILVGYDTRRDGDKFAQIVAATLAGHGFTVTLSDSFIPTPTLCWSVAHAQDVIGGVMLTASHNPAQYLGIKIRMADGGASPVAFTQRVEAALKEEPSEKEGAYEQANLIDPYLDNLASLVDGEAIARANLRVVVDSLYGAAQGYLANTMRKLGVEVKEIHEERKNDFGGLHPEPIKPWVDAAAKATTEGSFDAAFVTDGDADRLGAVAGNGEFVNPHRIFVLVLRHLVINHGKRGKVVRTLSGSELIARQCDELNLELVTTPIGFKWIYEQMCDGGVLIGGEESGGIGIPSHVMERDGLLMSLLLLEMMATEGKDLVALVDEALRDLGRLEYARRDRAITSEQHKTFLSATFDQSIIAGVPVANIITTDGVKFVLEDGTWLLLRASGTEPLIRIYAEAPTAGRVNELLDAGCELVERG